MFGLTPFRKRQNSMDKHAEQNPWEEMNRAFNEFFNNDAWTAPFFAENGMMRADIRETDKEYVVEAELPGVDKKDIHVELKDGLLTISVNRDEQVNVEGDNYIRRERRSSGMNRSFHVGNVKEEDVKASYKNGMLTVTLPKRASGKAGRTIYIE